MRPLRRSHSSRRLSPAKPPPPAAALQQPFQAGESVPVSGVYRVIHAGHRPRHEVSMVVEETFPKCRTCGDAVRYELVIGEGARNH